MIKYPWQIPNEPHPWCSASHKCVTGLPWLMLCYTCQHVDEVLEILQQEIDKNVLSPMSRTFRYNHARRV